MKKSQGLFILFCLAFIVRLNAVDLYVGNDSPNNTNIIANETNTNYSNIYVGVTTNASNNTLEILSGGLLSNSGNIYIGYSGSYNSMLISDGGILLNSATNPSSIGITAASSNNLVEVTGAGSLWSNNGSLTVGSAGSSNTLLITDGGTVLTTGPRAAIGDAASSSNNLVEVTGAGSLWSNSSNFFVGAGGSSNTLIIADGGTVLTTGARVSIGDTASSSNNLVEVTGADSLWSNATLSIGNNGSFNTLIIADGGTVLTTGTPATGARGFLGNSTTSSNNLVEVTGAGSLWSNNTLLIIGNDGSFNMLLISDQATVIDRSGTLGSSISSSNNLAEVTGAGSLWSNNGSIVVGNSGSSNTLLISDGGTVESISGLIGNNTNSSNNSVFVTGLNSSWLISNTDLTIGNRGSSNTLVISDEATVIDRDGVIGNSNTSSNNIVEVTGANSQWENSSAVYIGYGGRGTLNISEGAVVTASSNIFIANQSGSVGVLNFGDYGENESAGSVETPTIAFGSGTGTMNFNQSNTLTLTSTITGSGTVQQLGSGTTILSGSNSYNGTTTILNGTLSAGSSNAFGTSALVLGGSTTTGTMTMSSALPSLSIASLNWKSNGVIQITPGSQTLDITGSMVNGGGGGAFSFSTLNNDTNTLITFASETGFTPADFSLFGITGYTFIQNANNLQGYLSTNANVTNNTGTITLTNTLSVGSYTQNSGGTLQIEVASPSSYGNIQASSSVNLGGTLEITPINNTPLTYGQKITFITSGGPINGSFDSIQIDQNSCRGRLVIEGDPTASIYIAPTLYTLMAQNQNQYNVATALNSFIPATSGDELTVSTALDELTASQYSAAFNAIMPTLYQSLSTIAFNLENANNMELVQRLWGARVMDGGFSMNGFGENMPIIQEQNKKIDPNDILRPGAKNPWGVFVDGNGIFAQANSGNMLPTYNAESGGVTTGLSYKWNDQVASGIYTGYQGVYTKYSNGAGSLVDNSVRFGLFGTYGQHEGKGFFVDGLIGGDYSGYNMQRNINFSTINRTATGTPGAGELDAMLASGYDFKKGNWTYGPLTSLQYAYFNVSQFNETGASSLDLNNVSWNTSSMIYSLGSHAAYRWEASKDVVVVPQISLSWQHEFLQNPYGIGANLGGINFNTLSTTPLRDTLYTGVGVSLEFAKKWDASLFYNAAAGNQDLISQNIFLSLGMKF